MAEGRSTSSGLTDQQKKALDIVASFATIQSRGALSRFSNLAVHIHSSEVVDLRLTDIPSFLGGLNSPAIGVHVPFHGDLEGNMLLLFPEEGVHELESRLLKPGTVHNGKLRDSAFSEIGNVLTGTILTVLSALTEKILINSPPLLVYDMAGAILDALLADMGSASENVTVIVFHLAGSDGGSLVKSVFIPGVAGIELLLEAAGKLGDVQ